MKKLLTWISDEWLNEILFSLLIITFPFGSFLFSFSVGFMTIYPFLVLLLILAAFGALRRFIPKRPLENYYFLFLILFLLTALAFLPFVESSSYALIDFRSISLMLLTGYVFLSVKDLLGTDRWRAALSLNLKILFFLIVSFSLFELLTGIHFMGEFTEHIIDRGIVDAYINSPVFLWDNPNNLSAYLILIGTAIIMLEPASKERAYFSMLILISCLFISHVAKARLGVYLCIAAILCYLVYLSYHFLLSNFKTNRKSFFFFLTAVLSLILVYFTNERFDEIPKNQERIFGKTRYKYPELVSEEQMLDTITFYNPVSNQVSKDSVAYRNSKDERLALFKNGLDFSCDSKFLGVGPGQFRFLHDEGRVNHYAYGNSNPHFWLIELLSQFGLIVFVPYIFLIGWIVYAGLRSFRQNQYQAIMLIAGTVIFGVTSVMPSSFLILDINWLFTSILVLIASDLTYDRNEKLKVNG